MFSSTVRKFSLTVHVLSSLGWLGAVIVFLVLSVIGISTSEDLTKRACYIAMGFCAWYVILPAALSSLVSGILQGLGTAWGIFKYYWIVVKLCLTVLATVLLILHMQPIDRLSEISIDGGSAFPAQSEKLQLQLIVNSIAAIVVLVFASVLSIYKPWGKIQRIPGSYSEKKKRS